MSSLKLFYDSISQPSRAVFSFLLFNKIPHEIKETRFFKWETSSEEYAKINPDKKVPTIIHNNNFILNESHAILRYLCSAYQVSEKWYYPNDIQQRAKIDAYLDWHHTNTRSCMRLTFGTNMAKKLGVKIWWDLEKMKYVVQNVLKFIDSEFLGQNKFIATNNEISLADLSAYCEIVQLKFLRYNFDPYVNIQKWMAYMESLPEIIESHAVFNKMLQNFLSKSENQPKL